METFSTRVELHHAHSTDYNVLHKEMSDRGFVQTVTTTDKKTYHLPTAEYRIEKALMAATAEDSAEFATLRVVQNLIKAAISATIAEAKKNRTSYLKGSCITSRTPQSVIFNLEEVK